MTADPEGCRRLAAWAEQNAPGPRLAWAIELNRFGDRQLNRALHVIVNWRMLHHDATHAYLTRRRAEQKTDPEIRRCLKRYTARQLFRVMEHPPGLDKP